MFVNQQIVCSCIYSGALDSFFAKTIFLTISNIQIGNFLCCSINRPSDYGPGGKHISKLAFFFF